MKAKHLEAVSLILVILLLGIMVFNVFQNTSMRGALEQAKEAARPAAIQVVTITDAGCPNCFSLEPVLSDIQKKNVNVTEEKGLDLASETAKKLVEKYAIGRVPAVLISGEIERIADLEGFTEREDLLIFEQTPPPYVETVMGEVRGLVEVTYLEEPSCKECTSLQQIADFEKVGVTVVKKETIDVGSAAGKALIRRYQITKIPTLLLSSEVAVYEPLAASWPRIGSVEEDGTYVLRQIVAPYFNPETSTIEGLVDLTLVTDQSCATCYNVSLQKRLLAGLGIVLDGEKTVDINSPEGKALRSKYDLTKVPTILLSADADAYFALKDLWKQVGTIENDGSYVFRELNLLGVTYKDLTTDGVVEPQPTEETTLQ